MTPWCSGQSSDQRPTCALTMLPPYRNGISPLGFTQILYRACSARMGSEVMCSLNLPVLVNLPRQMPRETSLSRSGREWGG